MNPLPTSRLLVKAREVFLHHLSGMNNILWFWLAASVLVVVLGAYYLSIKFDYSLLVVVGAFAMLIPFILVLGSKSTDER